MKKSLIINYGLLLLLTILTIFIGKGIANPIALSFFVLLLFGIKFLIVAFQFMEVKEAHNFWKISLLLTLGLLILVVLVVK